MVRGGYIVGVASNNYECNPKKPAVFFFGTLLVTVLGSVLTKVL